MPNQKVPQLPVLAVASGGTLLYVVDVSDTTDDPTGSSKQITRDNLLKNLTGLTVNGTITGNTFVVATVPTNNESPTQVLTRNSTTGQVEYTTAQSSGLFNYGLANAIMTGTFLT